MKGDMQSNFHQADEILSNVVAILRDNFQHLNLGQGNQFLDIQSCLRKRYDEIEASVRRGNDEEEFTQNLLQESQQLIRDVRRAIESDQFVFLRKRLQEPSVDSQPATHITPVATSGQGTAPSPSAKKWPVAKITVAPRTSSHELVASDRSPVLARAQPPPQPVKTNPRFDAHLRSHAEGAARLANGATSSNTRRKHGFADFKYMTNSVDLGAGSSCEGLTIHSGGYQNSGSVITKMPVMRVPMDATDEE